MTVVVFLVAVVAGGVGAALRYAVDVLISAIVGVRFPWGIFVVNVTGSFALGIVTGVAAGTDLAFVVGSGLLGGYTTFSTVAVTTALQAEERRRFVAFAYGAGTLVATVLAAGFGLALTGRLGG
ncbi:CrcB family protein [Microbacterium sp. X-17]|uniref:fluoride efflux transporter FluC n=1 Tax=Microbacterium sp. X-17 TaxID=3144404 RepID=UPI0031F5008B